MTTRKREWPEAFAEGMMTFIVWTMVAGAGLVTTGAFTRKQRVGRTLKRLQDHQLRRAPLSEMQINAGKFIIGYHQNDYQLPHHVRNDIVMKLSANLY